MRGAGAFLPPAAELAAKMEGAVHGKLAAGGLAEGEPSVGEPSVGGLVLDLVRSNLRQWELEDECRDPGASDGMVARAKRCIDRLNLDRHRLVQEIDRAVSAGIEQLATATLATESPGMVLDRLSVLVIRRARTAAASASDRIYADRLSSLEAQLVSLCEAFDSYVEELRAGTRRFIVYEHLKLYGAARPTAPDVLPR